MLISGAVGSGRGLQPARNQRENGPGSSNLNLSEPFRSTRPNRVLLGAHMLGGRERFRFHSSRMFECRVMTLGRCRTPPAVHAQFRSTKLPRGDATHHESNQLMGRNKYQSLVTNGLHQDQRSVWSRMKMAMGMLSVLATVWHFSVSISTSRSQPRRASEGHRLQPQTLLTLEAIK